MQAGHEIQSLPMNGQRHLDDSSLATADFSGEGSEKPKGGLKIRPILAMVWRNLPIILGVTALTGAIAYLGYRNTPLIYEGEFRILVEPITSQGRATDPTAISRAIQTTQDGSSVDYPTLLQVLQSPELLSKIAAQIQTRYPEVTASSLARDLRNQDFTVARIGTNMLDNTRALQVTYRGTDAQEIQFVLEKLAEGYLRFSLEDRKTRIGGGVEFIEDQLPGLQQRVTNLEAQIQAIRQQYRFTDPTIENQQVVEQLKEVQQRKLEAQTEFQEQATLYANLQNQLRLSPEQGLAASALSQNPRFQDLLTQRQRVQSQIAVGLARFTEDSPTIQRLREQEQNLNRLIGRETGSILGQSSPGIPGTTDVVAFQDPLRVSLISQLVTSGNQARALQARAAEITRSENNLNRRLIELPAIVRQYNTLQQQLDIATKTLNQFLLQRETLRVEAAQKEVPWEVIAKPKLVSSPITGKPVATRGKRATQMLLVGVAGGLFLGLLTALLREKMRNVFVTAEDLQDAVQQPFLASIPSAAKGLNQLPPGKSGTLSNPFLQAFSSLYTNLRFLNTTGINTVAITSVEPGDGKTIVAVNLAQTAASMGQRVLLVDANLLAPQVHNLLDVSNQRGLVDVLHQKHSVDEVVQKSSLDNNLSVLPAGIAQVGSTRLFASNEMQQLLTQLQTKFDLVIFDTPALDGLTDLNFLGAQADGFLMVVGVNKTKRSKFNKTLEGLKKYRIPVIGVIANHPNRQYTSYPAMQQSGSTSTEMPSAFLGNLKGSSDAVR
jgi:capsular exopolysaccharide synthesis family protein